jgi:IPT/TIG domain
VNITVSNDEATSAAVPADEFTYIPSPPVVEGVDPDSGRAARPRSVGIVGKNLATATNVRFGDTSVPFSIVSSTHIKTASPIAMTLGTIDVTVTTPEGTSPYLCPTKCKGEMPKYIYEAPTVTSVTPSEGPESGGTEITVQGTGFAPKGEWPTSILVGHREATSVECTSMFVCTAVTPAGKKAGTLPVTVVVKSNVSPKQSRSGETPAAIFTYE